MAGLATDTAAKGVLALSEAIGFDGDYQPVIRPVLDLSDIEDGMGNVNELFGSNSISVGKSAYLASNIAASRQSRRAMESVPVNKEENVNRLIDSFNEKMDSMTEEIKNLKIYMDGNTLVGYMSPRVNRTLGQQATLAGRMN
jgi:hypothetical protein